MEGAGKWKDPWRPQASDSHGAGVTGAVSPLTQWVETRFSAGAVGSEPSYYVLFVLNDKIDICSFMKWLLSWPFHPYEKYNMKQEIWDSSFTLWVVNGQNPGWELLAVTHILHKRWWKCSRSNKDPCLYFRHSSSIFVVDDKVTVPSHYFAKQMDLHAHSVNEVLSSLK